MSRTITAPGEKFEIIRISDFRYKLINITRKNFTYKKKYADTSKFRK